MQKLQGSQTDRRMFPTIQSGIINKEFVGLGHQLEQKRKERKRIQEQERIIQNRVLQLEKEQYRTNKQIEEKQKNIIAILQLKKRQDEEKKERERIQLEKQQQLNKLKIQSKTFRLNHMQRKQEMIEDIKSQKQQDFKQGKEGRKEREQMKKNFILKDLEEKQEIARQISQKQDQIKQSIVKFKKDKNLEHIEEYNRRIQMEEERKKRKENFIQSMERKESYLISKLQQSSQQHKKLQQTLSKARNLNIKELQDAIMQRSLVYPRSGQSSRLSSFTQDQIRRNRSKGSIQPQQSKTKVQVSNLNLQQYKKRIQEIASSVRGTDKFKKDNNINEKVENVEQQQQIKNAEKHANGKLRKRNKHINRSKDYELF